MTHKDPAFSGDAAEPTSDLTGEPTPTAPLGDAVDADDPHSDTIDVRVSETIAPADRSDGTESTTGKGSGDDTDKDAASSSKTSSGRAVTPTAVGSTWVALIVGAIILILLLVFIMQNGDSVTLQMFAWEWNFPIGVGMLISAVAGALIAASVGTVRIMQLRRQVKTGK